MNDILSQSLIVSGIPFKNKGEQLLAGSKGSLANRHVCLDAVSDWSGRTEMDSSGLEQTKRFWSVDSGSH